MAQDILQQRQQLSESYQDPTNALYDPNYKPENDFLLNNSNPGGINTAAEAARIGSTSGLDIPLVTSDLGITGGSDNIRAAEAVTKSKSEQLLSDLEAAQTTSAANLGAKSAELDRLLASTKELTAMDLSKIQAAQDAEAAKYDPLIAQAKENRRQTQARSNVGAGEIGGFMNTQYAGQAAITPVEGGNFVGAGGELARIKGQLDQNVFQLEQAKITAMAQAKSLAEKAIRTQKEEDYNMASDAYDRIAKASEAQQASIAKRADIISQIEKDKQARVEFTQKQQDRAYTRLKDLGSFGFNTNSFSSEEKTQLEKEAGLLPGTADAIIATSFDLKNAKTQEDQLDASNKVINILKDIPVGRKITIGDATYEGIKESNPYTQTFKEEDRNGNVTFVTIDQATGKIISTASGGRIGAGTKATQGEQLQTSFAGALDELRQSYYQRDNMSLATPMQFADPKVYSKLLDKFRQKGEAAKFMSNFPPEDFLDPNDPFALKFFQTSTQAQPKKDDFASKLDTIFGD